MGVWVEIDDHPVFIENAKGPYERGKDGKITKTGTGKGDKKGAHKKASLKGEGKEEGKGDAGKEKAPEKKSSVPHNPKASQLDRERQAGLYKSAAELDATGAFDEIKNWHAYSRVPGSVLEMVIDSGRLKNQFETATSGGALSPKMRMYAEKEVMGVAEDTPAAERPVYGYLHHLEGGDVFNSKGDESSYGEVAVKWKPGVKDKATFTGRDSLGVSGNIVASPVHKPSSLAFLPKDAAAIAKKGGLSKHPDMHKSIGYVEMQVHGGLHVSEIESIHFKGHQPPTEELAAKLDKLGIKYSVHDTGHGVLPIQSKKAPPRMDPSEFFEELD